MKNKDLKRIKQKYGEKMAHLCRDLFPALLEKEGLLSSLVESKFHADRSLYETIVSNNKEENFKSFIYSLVDVENNNEVVTHKTPQELLDEAGYILYECHSEEDIQAFKKYYASGEALCTFRGYRLDSCHVFFAVKKNIAEIKRKNFDKPERQDEYGTSVISIQFSRKGHHLSIKNRYNHKVNNPDSTFSNNLENIIEGLTKSFESTYNLEINQNTSGFELPNYTRANDGKYYRYNYEIDNVYYCPDNIIITNGEVEHLDKSRTILIDNFILCLEGNVKNLTLPMEIRGTDSFVDYYNKVDNIVKIEVTKIKDGKEITIIMDSGEASIIKINQLNQIVGYDNPHLLSVGIDFLRDNEVLTELNLPKLRSADDRFLSSNTELEKLSLPYLEEAGNDFLAKNRSMKELNLPHLKVVGRSFLHQSSLERLSLPSLTEAGKGFLYRDIELEKLDLPKLETAGNGFLQCNAELKELSLPHLKVAGDSFLHQNKLLKKINLPNLAKVGDSFLHANKGLEEIEVPQLKEAGVDFLSLNQKLKRLFAPKLERVDMHFLNFNLALEELDLPSLRYAGSSFLNKNKDLKRINAPVLKAVSGGFLFFNQKLETLNMPELETAGPDFLSNNNNLRELILPKLRETGYHFMRDNKVLEVVELPSLEEGFLYYPPNLTLDDFSKQSQIR